MLSIGDRLWNVLKLIFTVGALSIILWYSIRLARWHWVGKASSFSRAAAVIGDAFTRLGGDGVAYAGFVVEIGCRFNFFSFGGFSPRAQFRLCL